MSAAQLALAPQHREAGAVWTERAGWSVPAHYGDPRHEYAAAGTGALLVDQGHASLLRVRGPDAIDFLHRLTTGDVRGLADGAAMPNCLVTERGRLIDLVLTLREGEEILLIGSPGAAASLSGFLRRYHIMEELEILETEGDPALFGLMGARAGRVANAFFQGGAGPPASYGLARGRIEDVPLGVLRLPPVAGGWFLLLVAAGDRARVWSGLLGGHRRLVAGGRAAADALEVEWGWPAYGHEISDRFNPLEVGLRDAVSFEKGCYIGQEVIARLDTYQKVGRTRVGLRVAGECPPGPGEGEEYPLRAEGRRIGQVTSLVPVPGQGRVVGQAVVRADRFRHGLRGVVEAPDGPLETEIVRLPLEVQAGAS